LFNPSTFDMEGCINNLAFIPHMQNKLVHHYTYFEMGASGTPPSTFSTCNIKFAPRDEEIDLKSCRNCVIMENLIIGIENLCGL